MSEKTPLVSVLTTCYNREKYIAEAIESVLAQTFTDFEYIIVDDNSSDRSYEIACEYAKRDPRIRVYRNEKNLGDYPNRNKAASYAQGKYLKYLDSDDLLYPHCLQVFIDGFARFPQASVAISAICQEDDHPFPILFSPQEVCLHNYFGTTRILGRSPLAGMILREAFEQIHGFSGAAYIGDQELWMNMVFTHKFLLVASGLSWYRNHQDQENKYENAHKMMPFARIQLQLKFFASDDCPLTREERLVLTDRYEWLAVHRILTSILSFRWKDAGNAMKYMDFSLFRIFSVFLKKCMHKIMRKSS